MELEHLLSAPDNASTLPWQTESVEIGLAMVFFFGQMMWIL